MDNNKKQQNYSRSGNGFDPTTNRQKTSSDIQSAKNWPKNSKRRENPQTSARNNNNNTSKQQQPQQLSKARPNVDKRARARGYGNNSGFGGSHNDYIASSSGLVVDSTIYAPSGEGAAGQYQSKREYELHSVYSPGSKKQNLNHLLNFYYTPREVDYYDGGGGHSSANYGQRHGHVKKHKYNKEQFLQANFQFVIKSSAKRKTNDSPDTLIDWSLIEQINIQTPEEQQCPICLYPPVAAKVTRCGHIYCWPCILHYLSLSDKTWRKCPICYDAVHVSDLKSASIVQQKSFSVGSEITLQLMRRKKGSLVIEKYESWKNDENIEKYPFVSSPTEDKLFSKFILAKRVDIADIVDRERKELLADVDESCPEFVFIQQAMEFLRERSDILGEIETKGDDTDELVFKPVPKLQLDTDVIIDASNNDTNESENTSENEPAVEASVSTNTEMSKSNIATTSPQSSAKFYYFYQADDGQNIYLHPLNVKMLQACYGSLSCSPPTVKSRILQKEQHSMDEEHRRKFTCLGHLPLTCQFSVVEIDLQPPFVTQDVIKSFKTDILHRKKERQRRAREEREREKHINAINDRQMGKLIASTANINITSSHEFPTCGFEEPLLPMEPADNFPSTSKGSRNKTISTSSAGSCSYSSIAIHCQQEHAPWTTLSAAKLSKDTVGMPSEDDDEIRTFNNLQTNLGEVLAQALSQKKSDQVPAGSKKSKKSKKMLPLFSTGMNFSGN